MRYILSPIIIFFLLLIIFISIQTPNINPMKSTPMIGDYNFENVRISFLKNGKKEWELTASQSTVFNESTKFYLVDVNGQYFGDNQKSALIFSSPTGAYFTDNGTLKLVKTSSKLVFNNQSYFIRSDELELNSKNKMLSAYGNLNINSDNLILTAQKMIGNLEENKIYFSYDIQGSLFTNTTN
ncbi:MAG: LPS export ABC transporter periplasmic protein LptC [Candidatus Margulisiibacteriota bacterium]